VTLFITALARERLAEPTVTDASAAEESLCAFYTAPPAIPHEISVRSNRECLTCHQDVMEIGDRVSVKTPHPQLSNCTQCHVGPQRLNRELEVTHVASGWLGLEAPEPEEPPNEFLPPTIPHQHFMRENCSSCHDSEHPVETMRGPHPARTQCLQCHVYREDRGLLVQ
jgi:hypothetical protein